MTLTDQLQQLMASLAAFGPELWLGGLFVSILLADLVLPPARSGRWLFGLTVLGLGGHLILVATTTTAADADFLGMVRPRQATVQGLLTLAGLLTLSLEVFGRPLVARATVSKSGSPQFSGEGEYYALLVGVLLGLQLMVSARHLLLLYLAVEVASIGAYVLTAFRLNAAGAEGSLKYALFGGAASAVMLYGMSWLYGLTGTLYLDAEFTAGLAAAQAAGASELALLGILLTLCGLLFKLGAVPFHWWAPDVYQAAPMPVVAFFSVAPKTAAVVAVMLFVPLLPAGALVEGAGIFLAVVAIGSVLWGNLSALWQQSARRLLAYSSIAQAGFLLLIPAALAASSAGYEAAGLQESLLFYLGMYLLSSFLSIGLVWWVERQHQHDALTGFAGLGKAAPLFGVSLLVAMLALTGLPPTVGFTAKFLLFSQLWGVYSTTGSTLLLGLFGLGLLNAVIALFYYLKLPYFAFFREPDAGKSTAPLPFPAQLWIGLLAALLLGLFFYPQGLFGLVQ